MRKFENGTNVDTPTADYPRGRSRDQAGVTPGTILNEFLRGDIEQFFVRLLELANITENDLPDNVTNGYQLIDALNSFNIRQNERSETATAGTPSYIIQDDEDLLDITFSGTSDANVTFPDPAANAIKGRTFACRVTNDITTNNKFAVLNLSNFERQTTDVFVGMHAIMVRSNGSKWMVLSKTYVEIACPFLYVNGKYYDEVLQNVIGSDNKTTESHMIPVNVGDNVLKVTEEKDEITTIDSISIKDGSTVTLLAENLTLAKGDEIEFNITSSSEEIEFIITGYYVKV